MKIVASYYFFYYLALSVYSPYVTLYFTDKGLSSASAGILLSLWALAGVVAPPILGMLSDRLRNPVSVIRLCTVAAPIAGLGFYFFDRPWMFAILAVVFAGFQSSAIPLSDALAVRIGSREGFSFSSIRLWGALSFTFGSLATGFVYVHTGYEMSFLVFAAISVPLFLVLLRYPDTEKAGERPPLLEQVGDVFRNRPLLLFTCICFLVNLCIATNLSFLPLYFKELEFDLGLVGSAYSAAAIIEVPVFLFASRLISRFGRFPILCFAAALYAVKYLIMFLARDVYLTLALQLLDGVAFALFMGVTIEVVDKLAGEKTKASSQTLFSALTWGLGGIIGNAAGGAILHAAGAPFLYLLLGIISAIASLLYVAVKTLRRSVAAAEA